VNPTKPCNRRVHLSIHNTNYHKAKQLFIRIQPCRPFSHSDALSYLTSVDGNPDDIVPSRM
jgi:hypothetical protein